MILNYNKNSNRAGIYTITNLKTNKVLICHTYNFKRKWARDREALQNKTFNNREFQRDYYQNTSSYEDDFIVFDIIEITENLKKEERKAKELFYVEKYKQNNFVLYNKAEQKKEKIKKLSRFEKEEHLFISLFQSKLKETICNLLKFSSDKVIVFECTPNLLTKLKSSKVNLKNEISKYTNKFIVKELNLDTLDFFWKASVKELKRSYCQSIKLSDLKIK